MSEGLRGVLGRYCGCGGARAIPFAVMLLGGCTDHREAASRVNSTAPLEFVEVARIGGAGAQDESAFGAVAAVALSHDERFVTVIDGLTQSVHRFTSVGEHVRTFGGRGWGPGDIQAARAVWETQSGELCVWDTRILRVTRFDSTGHVLQTIPINIDQMSRFRPSFVGFLSDCSFVLADRALARTARREREGFLQDTLHYYLYGSDGVDTRLLRVEPEVATYWLRGSDGNGRATEEIFAPRVFATLRLDELWVGVSDSLRWHRFDTTGSRLERFDLPTRIRPATSTEVARERERRLDSLPELAVAIQGPFRQQIVSLYQSGIRNAPARGTLPAYDDLVAGIDGSLWVRETPVASDSRARWLLIDARGKLQGYLNMPRDARLKAATGGTAVFLELDELDAPVLSVRVQKPNRNAATQEDSNPAS